MAALLDVLWIALVMVVGGLLVVATATFLDLGIHDERRPRPARIANRRETRSELVDRSPGSAATDWAEARR
jgi:hypothetical protein